MNEVKKLNKKLVAKNIRRMISESGCTIESIAAELEISDRLIYYWLNGKRTLRLKMFTGCLNCSTFRWKAFSHESAFSF